MTISPKNKRSYEEFQRIIACNTKMQRLDATLGCNAGIQHKGCNGNNDIRNTTYRNNAVRTEINQNESHSINWRKVSESNCS